MSESRKQRIEQFIQMGKTRLADHAILARGPDFVDIGRSHRGDMLCRISVYRGHLVLIGDADPMIWAYYEGQDIEGAIEWIASGDIENYVRQKAYIGMGGIGVDAYEHEVAIADVVDRIKMLREESADRSLIAKWEKVLGLIKELDEDQHEVQSIIFRETGDFSAGSLGVVVSSRLIWAWMLVRRAHALIDKPVGSGCRHDR